MDLVSTVAVGMQTEIYIDIGCWAGYRQTVFLSHGVVTVLLIFQRMRLEGTSLSRCRMLTSCEHPSGQSLKNCDARRGAGA